MRRPALRAVIALCAGISLSHFTAFPLPLVYSIILGASLIYLGLSITRSKYVNLLTYIIIGTTGILWSELRTTQFPENHVKNYISESGRVTVVSHVTNDPDRRTARTFLECRAESLLVHGTELWRPVTGKMRVSVNRERTGWASRKPTMFPYLKYGDVIEMSGKLRFPRFPRNPESFDYRAWLRQKGIHAQMSIWNSRDIKVVDRRSGNPIVSKIALPAKRYFRNTIDRYLSWVQASFLKAILLRERGDLPEITYEYFQSTGVVHVLAVSGLHVAIIAMIVFTLLSVSRIPLIPRQIATAILLIIYALMTGARPPVVRATIMSILAMVALTIERDTDIFNTMSFAGLLILIIHPQALFDLGFLLSFGAVISIVGLYPKVYPLLFGKLQEEGRSRIGAIALRGCRACAQLFTVSLCAQLGVLPIIAYSFFRVSIVSTITNLIVVPLTGTCISLTLAMSLLNLLPWQIPVQIIAGATWATATFLLKFVEWFDKIPYAYLWVPRPPIWTIGFYYVLLLSLVHFPTSRTARKILVYGCLIFLNAVVWINVHRVSNPELRVTCLDVSRGNCVFVEMPGNRNVLIDAGSWEPGWDAGVHTVAPFLRARGISKIDLAVVTGPKIFRIGGMKHIIEDFRVEKFVCPSTNYRSRSWRNLLESVNRKELDCQIIEANNLYVRLDYKDISFLFHDNGPTPELPCPTNCTVVTVSKHRDDQYVSAGTMSPQVAVLSCGKSSRRANNISIVEEYEKLGTMVLRTDKEGAVTITTDGNTLHVKTMKQLYRDKMEKLTFSTRIPRIR
jgi:competence protein ComEC